jgi:hypothetical protein
MIGRSGFTLRSIWNFSLDAFVLPLYMEPRTVEGNATSQRSKAAPDFARRSRHQLLPCLRCFLGFFFFETGKSTVANGIRK